MRNTRTGAAYEEHIKHLIETHTPHMVRIRHKIGKKRNGGDHEVDIVLNDKELISLKYQKTKGTAEEKIPFEMLKLQWAIEDHRYDKATIVLAGNDDAWTLKDAYLSGEFANYMNCPSVRIISHEQFLNEYIGENFVDVDLSSHSKVSSKSFSKMFC